MHATLSSLLWDRLMQRDVPVLTAWDCGGGEIRVELLVDDLDLARTKAGATIVTEEVARTLGPSAHVQIDFVPRDEAFR